MKGVVTYESLPFVPYYGGVRYLDWQKAKQICLENPTATISAGLVEDWGWTSDVIFKDGKFTGDYVRDNSFWATPIVDVDGKEIECWKLEPNEYEGIPAWWEETTV